MTEPAANANDVDGIEPKKEDSTGIDRKKTLHILCMDDDPGLARLLQLHLSRAGHVVRVAHDGMTGLSMHRCESYDFLVIDYRMPGLNGIDVLRTLSSEGEMPASVILTGAGDEKTAVEAMKLGASDYIIKDPDGGYLELMHSVIQRSLHQRQLALEKKDAEEKLRKAYAELEKLVAARTAELIVTNDALREEIRERNNVEERLRETHKKLEYLVKERTRDLEAKTASLEELNITLNCLLNKRNEDQKELEENILSNVKKFIFPCIEKLKKSLSNPDQIAWLRLLESHVNEIISPFSKTLSSRYSDLTPTEIRIAEMIRHDSATKEMAEFLNLSVSAIIFHRNNIRKKLGLVNKKINLKVYLQTLP